jgi:hypothetical protein
MRQQGRQPWSWKVVLIRGFLALVVLLLVLYLTQLRPRIDTASLEHGVAAKMHTTPARCSDQTRNGSRWTCLVGTAPASRCVVVNVSIIGSLSLERHPKHCHYP